MHTFDDDCGGQGYRHVPGSGAEASNRSDGVSCQIKPLITCVGPQHIIERLDSWARATGGTFLPLKQKHSINPTGLHVRSKDQSSLVQNQSLSVQDRSLSVQDQSPSVLRVTPTSGFPSTPIIWDFGLVAEDELMTQFLITSDDRDTLGPIRWPTTTFISSCLRLMISNPSPKSWPTDEIGWELFREAARQPIRQSCVWRYRSLQLVEEYRYVCAYTERARCSKSSTKVCTASHPNQVAQHPCTSKFSGPYSLHLEETFYISCSH